MTETPSDRPAGSVDLRGNRRQRLFVGGEHRLRGGLRRRDDFGLLRNASAQQQGSRKGEGRKRQS